MKKLSKRAAVIAASLMLTGFAFISSHAQVSELPVDEEYKTFTDCWGSGASGVSCSNPGATVYGCQPDPGSSCVGKLRE